MSFYLGSYVVVWARAARLLFKHNMMETTRFVTPPPYATKVWITPCICFKRAALKFTIESKRLPYYASCHTDWRWISLSPIHFPEVFNSIYRTIKIWTCHIWLIIWVFFMHSRCLWLNLRSHHSWQVCILEYIIAFLFLLSFIFFSPLFRILFLFLLF